MMKCTKWIGVMLLVGVCAQAATVVDTDFSISNVSIDSYAVNTDTERFRDWSESAPMYNGVAANGALIYGGVHITADSGVRGQGGYVGINSQFNALFARPAPKDDYTTNSTTQVLYLWDSADFLISGFSEFDETASSSFTATLKNFNGLVGGLRFVIRDGDTYYVANETSLNAGVSATASLAGDAAGLQWAAFDPANFDAFDDDDANLGFGSVSFSSRTFSNVTGVGLIANAVSSGYTQIVMTDFQAALSDSAPPAAPFTLHGLFTDRMILQRDENVAVYGQAGAGEQVTVTFAGQTNAAIADVGGSWTVQLAPMVASFTPRVLTVSKSGSPDLMLSDVLVGDVWVVSGQSNMDRWFKAYPVLMADISGVNNDQLRIFRVDNGVGSLAPETEVTPHEKLGGSWQVAEEAYLEFFSPAGYYFAKRLNLELNIPIGIIQAGLGATTIESWLPSWLVESTQEYEYMIGDQWPNNVMDQAEIDAGAEMALRGTSGLYNHVVAPLREFTFKGFGWCQGESNSRHPYIYRQQMPDLISAWRQDFNMPDEPFLVVEIAPYGGYNYERAAWLRDAQTYSLTQTNVGFVTTVDIGEYEDIHPQAKEAVGDRMAYLALELDGLSYSGVFPSYKSMTVNGSTIEIDFNDAASLSAQEVRMNHYPHQPVGQGSNVYVVAAGTVEGFEICGSDEVFVDAVATIFGDKVIVSAPGISSPVAVRYAWENFPLANLASGNGLPVRPFRTDDFVSPFDPPVFNTSVLSESIALGSGPFSADMSAVDPNANPLIYSTVSYTGPSADWLTIDPDTGAVSGTPTMIGDFHWVVAVKDKAFNDKNSFTKVYAEIQLTVTGDDNQPPVITIIEPENNATYPYGSSLYVKVEVTDDVGVDRVNLWIDGETVKVLRDTTYEWGGPSGLNDPNGLLSNMTNGTYDLQILTWDTFGVRSITNIFVTVEAPPSDFITYNEWYDSFQLTGSDTNLLANPDGDQYNNLLEYAFGGNPTNALNEEYMEPVFQMVTNMDVSYMEYTFLRRTQSELLGLDYIVEHCGNLGDEWSANNVSEVSVTTTNAPAGLENVTVQVEASNPHQFLLLKIVYQDIMAVL